MTEKSRRSLSLKQSAYACLQSNKLKEALKFCTKACKTDSQDVEAWFLLAGIHSRLGDIEQVITCCRQVILLEPGNISAYYNLGVALQAKGLLEDAAESYRTVTRLQPSHTQAHTSLGLALFKLDCLSEAESSAQIATQRIPDLVKGNNYLCLLELGELLQKLKKYNDACACYQNAIKIKSGLLKAHFELGHTWYLQENYVEAANSYNEVLRIDPGHTPTINNLGLLYEKTGQPDKAIKLFETALKLTLNQGIPYRNLGRIYFTRKDFKSAINAYHKAIEAEPENTEAHFYLGLVYLELEDRELAARCFKKVLALEPDQRDAKYFLAILKDTKFSIGAKSEYVAGLFDDYAEKFDNELVCKLQYKTPELITDAIKKAVPNGRDFRILDAGCGTGLCGPLLRDIAKTMDGVDLSPKMIDKARERGIYDNLIVGELTESLQHKENAYDIIVAADVFVYIGDLSEVFRSIYASLLDGGILAFSTEHMPGDGFSMRTSGRFAHSSNYINTLANDTGYKLISCQNCELRKEHESIINGTVYIFRKFSPE